MTDWISVEERLPSPYDIVLATDGVEVGFAAYQKHGRYWLGDDNFEYTNPDITHWQPLPELPRKEQNNDR